ncbi:MAG TPA: DUF4340 domain-containing protein [Thermoanaerobaculia bacterium]|nr:DUF4340 domain-containing protein [Thermoanaerobaculia bacterium]
MRPRTLLVLLGLVLACAAFIQFYERKLPSSTERTARAKKVLELDKDQVRGVTIAAGPTEVRLERVSPGAGQGPGASDQAGQGPGASDKTAEKSAPPAAEKAPSEIEWRIVKPIAARADTAAVDRLLEALAGLEKTRTMEKVSPAAVGLDRPQAVVRLATLDPKTRRGGETVLQLGAEVPTGGSLIAAIAGKPEAYVVSDSILGDLRKPPGDWRDRRIFHGDRDRIERIALAAGGGPKVLLARRGDRFWIESPIADRADRDQVEKLLTDLTGLSAERFVDGPAPPAGQLGLDPPRAVVEAVLARQAQPLRIELGASHPGPPQGAPPAGENAASPDPPDSGAGSPPSLLTYARASGTLFETRTPLAEAAARPPSSWRSPSLSGLEVHQIDAATVRGAGAPPITLTRSGTDWKRNAATISYLPVSDLLFAVTDAKADRLLAPDEARALAAALARPPLLAFELKAGAAGNETLTLYPPLAAPAGKAAPGDTPATARVPARASGRDVVLLLPESKLKDIQDKLAAVRTAAPLAPEKKPGKGK